MIDKQDIKAQGASLKELRQEHAETVTRTQAYLKAQQQIRKALKAAMQAGPMTVPQIAAAVDLPADQVLWHVTAMKKYDQVTEVGQDGEYYQYALTEEVKA